MFGRLWILTTSALAASVALADAPKTKIVLSQLTSQSTSTVSDTIIWRPEAHGLARYEVIIPRDGVERALKYLDTSELFYMSQVRDIGIALTHQQTGDFSFSISPEDYQASFSKNLSPTFSYHLGVHVKNEQVVPALGGSWRHVTGHTQLDQVNVSVSAHRTKASWARARLSFDEKSETLYSVSNTDGKLGASFGMRWFDFFSETDLLAKVAVEKGSLQIGGQIERQFDSANGFLGLATDFQSDEISLSVGIQCKFGKLEVSNSLRSSEFFSNNAPSLNAVRHLNLASQWRNDIQLRSSSSDKP